MSKISYTENFNLTQYSEVDEPVFLNDITRDNALIDEALKDSNETAQEAVSTATNAQTVANESKDLSEALELGLQTTNENVASLEDRVAQNESDIAVLQPARITALENKVDSNTNLISGLSNELDSVEATVDAHGERLDALESTAQTLTNGLAEVNSELDECCQTVTGRLDTIDAQQVVQDGRLDSFEGRMTTAEEDIDNLQTEDETITAQIEILSQRVTQLLSDLDPTNIQSALALTQQVISNTTNIATLTADLGSLEDTVGDGTLVTTAQNVIDAINELAGATTVLDTELSTSSTNAVENRAIASVVGVGTLQTTAQNLVDACNELLVALGAVDTREATHYSNLSSAVNANSSAIDAIEAQNGSETLATYSQTLSGAVNELHSEIDSAVAEIDALATVATTGSYTDLVNVPTFATVATSGSYEDLSDKPNLSTVAITGDYADLSNTPNLSIYETVTSGNLVRSRVSALETQNGSEVLTTDAQTLSGAVNELDSDLGAVEATVGDSTSGLVKDVNDLQTTVGDSSAGLVKDVADNATSIGTLESTVGDSNSGLVKDVADAQSDISTLETTVGDSTSGLVKDVADLETDAEYEKWISLGELDQSNYNTYSDLANAFYPLFTSGLSDWTEYEFRIVVRKGNELTQIYTFDNCNMNSGYLNFKLIFDAGSNGMLLYMLSVMSSGSYWHSFEARGSNSGVTWSYNDLAATPPGGSAKWYPQRRKLKH